MKSERYRLDHVGIVVPDLDAAVDYYVETFGMQVVSREAETDVDSVAIGLPGEHVRLRGAILDSGSAMLEIHEYISPGDRGISRRPSDRGIGHIAFQVTNIHSAWEQLSRKGIRFNSTPSRIPHGALEGRWWVYGIDPFGVVVELCQHPT